MVLVDGDAVTGLQAADEFAGIGGLRRHRTGGSGRHGSAMASTGRVPRAVLRMWVWPLAAGAAAIAAVVSANAITAVATMVLSALK